MGRVEGPSCRVRLPVRLAELVGRHAGVLVGRGSWSGAGVRSAAGERYESGLFVGIVGDGASVNLEEATRTPAIYRAMLAAAPKGGE